MNSWIFPSNPKMYDVLGALRNLEYIYWTQRVKKIFVGDIVYIYLSAPVSRIIYKCVVLDKDIPFSNDILNDKEYWRNGYTFYGNPLTNKYIKLHPLEENHNERLNFWGLKLNGERSNLMGAKKIRDELYLSYIEEHFGI